MSPGPHYGVTFAFSLEEDARLESVEGSPEALLGFTAEELLAAPSRFLERIHPADSELAQQIFGKDGPETATACLRLCHADGRIRVVQADFRREGGKRLRLTLQDAKALLGASGTSDCSANLRSVLENTSKGMVFKDRNHVYTAAGSCFTRTVEDLLEGRDLAGLTDYDFLPERDADEYYALEKQVLLTGESVQGVHEIVRSEGPCWIQVDAHPVKSISGEVIGLFATAVNLTQRIRAEEQVYEANRALPDSAKLPLIGTYILDIRRCAFATSVSLDTMLGLPPEYPRDVAGWLALVHPEDREAVLGYMEEVIAAPGRIFNREYRILRVNDGELRWVQGIGRIDRDRQGHPVLMRGSVQDITDRKATEAALRETKNRLELFIEHAPAALAMYDREMRYLAISRRWRQVYGVDGDILGRRHYDLVPDLPERWKDAHQRGLAGESMHCEEDRFDRADGSVLWVRWEMMPWRQDDGSIGGILLFAEDITERKRAQQRLELGASVFADASEAIFVTDLCGNIMEVNECFTRTTGYGREEILGKHSHVLKSGRHDEEFYGEVAMQVRGTGRWRGEQWFRRKDGTDFQVSATITTVFDGDGKPAHYVGLFFDVTPLKEQERRLEQAAHYDELTGQPNRTLALERLRTAIAAAGQTGQRVGLILLDLDDFKSVNQVHGRQVADELLVSVASRMRQALREGDTLGRIGGDEFVVVLPDLAEAGAAMQVVEKLLAAVSSPEPHGMSTLQVSATAGVTFYPQAEEVDADQLIRQAVQAMYEAKLAGKDRCQVFDPARDSNLRGKLGEIGRIRQALKAGEFVLHYQPKVNMSTGALLGAEGLMRWQHPQRGLLLPGAFLPVTEDHDLALDLGEWVIAEALRQIGAWNREGHPVCVSVNVSARHLQQADFVQRLRGLLEANPDADPACLELEILETSTVQDVEHVSNIISACAEMGIQVAIDDFGTGYSSLSYLKRLPAPVLKLDQSFVRDMLEDPDDLAILQGVIGLANAFRRTVVAEGVETVEQGMMLLRMGCSYAQGYGIARPMPAEELVTWYTHWWPDPRWREAEYVNPQDWPILVAQVEVRHWTRGLEGYLRGLRPNPPEMDEARSRVGLWLSGAIAGRPGSEAIFTRLEKLHHEMHSAARQAVKGKQAGDGKNLAGPLHTALGLGEQMENELARLLPRVDRSHVDGEFGSRRNSARTSR